jgi:hypothetical protein
MVGLARPGCRLRGFASLARLSAALTVPRRHGQVDGELPQGSRPRAAPLRSRTTPEFPALPPRTYGRPISDDVATAGCCVIQSTSPHEPMMRPCFGLVTEAPVKIGMEDCVLGHRDQKPGAAGGYKSREGGSYSEPSDARSYAAVVIRNLKPPKTKIITVDDDGQVVDEEIVDGGSLSPLTKASVPTFSTCPVAPEVGGSRERHPDPSAQQRQRPTTGPTSPFLRLEEASAYSRSGKKRLLDWVRRGLLHQTSDPDDRRFFRVEDLDAAMSAGPDRPDPVNITTQRRPPENRTSKLKPVYPRTKPRPPNERK